MSGDQPMSFRFTMVFVLSFVCLALPAWADGQVGVDAYKRGDYATALRECRPRAEQRDAGAQFYLGTLYAFGQGVPHDDAKARWWYEQAAAQGLADAQTSLGMLYEEGLGVPHDNVHAYTRYSFAAAHLTGASQKFAAERRDEVAGLMTPAQIAEAQKLAREWKPKPYERPTH